MTDAPASAIPAGERVCGRSCPRRYLGPGSRLRLGLFLPGVLCLGLSACGPLPAPPADTLGQQGTDQGSEQAPGTISTTLHGRASFYAGVGASN
ncbi:hypothetical protein [Acidisoma sp. C75]